MKAYHDIYVQNFLSSACKDNQATVENYISLAKSEGLEILGFANRIWDENIPLPPPNQEKTDKHTTAFGMQIRNQIPEDTGDLKVLVGANVRYCGMFDILGMGAESMKKLDYLLITHCESKKRGVVFPEPEEVTRARAKLAALILEGVPGISEERAASLSRRPSEKEMLPYMDQPLDLTAPLSDFMVSSFRGILNNETLKAYSSSASVAISEPFLPLGEENREAMLARITDETYGSLFSEAAARGIGLVIGPHTDNAEDLRMLGIAKECGCKFALGSGLLARGEFGSIRKTEAVTEKLGITEAHMMDFVRR